MGTHNTRDDEERRRRLQEYIFSLEEIKEEAERLSAEHQRLKRSQQLLVDNVPIGFMSFDTHGRLFELNRRLVEILGSPSEEATREINVLTFPPLVECGMSGAFKSCMERAELMAIEAPYKSKWGKECYLRWYVIPVTDEEGRVLACQVTVEDITERKSAEEALRESEERYRLLAQNSLTGIYIHQEGKFVYVNERQASMLQYAPEEMIGVEFWNFVHPEDRDLVTVRGLARSRGQAAPPEYEFRALCKDGSTRWLHVLAATIMYRGATANMGNVADVTERKLSEEKLAEELKKFQALYDVAVSMTAERTMDENLQLLAEKSRQVLGADTAFIALRDEAAGELRMQAHSGIRTESFKGLRIPIGEGIGGKVAQTGRPFIADGEGAEVSPWLPDVVKAEGLASGIVVPVQVGRMNLGVLYAWNRTKTSFTRSQLDTLSLLGNLAAVEITRERAEGRLRESEERYRELYEKSKRAEELYRSLLDSSPDAVVVYDPEGRTQYVNASFTRIFGWTTDEVIGRRIPFVPESETEATMTQIERVMALGIPVSRFVSRRLTKEGGTLDVSVSASRVHDHQGNPAGMLAILHDITEQKRLEEQLRQATKLEAIGRLAGGVAHDFNNLLTAVLGYSDVLLQQIPQRHPYWEKIFQINRAAERATSLTRQLLAFGRAQVLDVKLLDLNEVIVDLEQILRRLIGENIDLEIILSPQLGQVEADLTQVEQILINLAVNARDAMPKGGKLTIETSNVHLDEQFACRRDGVEPGPHVMIAVSDTGHGMDAGTLSRIFDPFFTTKGKGRGTGLGLSTVYGIVKQHRGHISVYSELGQGAAFKVYLPQKGGQTAEAPEARPSLLRQEGKETVLLVEDEEIVRELACEILETLGYSVMAAADPAEALRISAAHQGRIHLLLTDVVLPQMDGGSLYAELAGTRPDMKVLYVSGYTANFITSQGALNPGVNFLEKPFTVESLANKVREVLDKP